MAFEIEIIKLLQQLSSPALDGIMSFWSFLSDYTIIIAVFLLLFFNKKCEQAWFFAGVEIVCAGIQKTLKLIVSRDRPWVVCSQVKSILESNGTSFPSGHSVTAMGVAIILLYFVYKSNKSKGFKIVTTIGAVIYLLLNAFNRMYLGQHYLTDIIAGYALMAVLCTIAILCYKYYHIIYVKLTDLVKKLTTKKDYKIEKEKIN